MPFKPLLSKLKNSGYRITEARRAIVALLATSQKHLSADDILKKLKNRKLTMNKTTVYRELYFLRDLSIIDELSFADRRRLYEIAKKHHHHLICRQCGRTEEFKCAMEVNLIRNKIQSKKFKLISHSLEFFGLCPNCR